MNPAAGARHFHAELAQLKNLLLEMSSLAEEQVRTSVEALLHRDPGRAEAVILADRDKVEMEDDIKAQVDNLGTTKIIVRSGDPMNLAELEVANPHTARSIIVLAPDDADDPDSTVIKTALAVTNNPRRKDGTYHIVGELREPGNLEAATLVGRDERRAGSRSAGSSTAARATPSRSRAASPST